MITLSELGGAQRFVVNLIKNLDESKYDLAVAAGEENGPNIKTEVKKSGVEFYVLDHARRSISPLQDILTIFELRRLIKKFRPDVLFLNSSKPTVWGPLAVYFPTRVLPVPEIVYRIGGWSFNDPQPFWQRWLWILIEKIFAKYKDVIIVNNRHDFDQAKKLGIRPRHKLELVYNGIDPYKLELLDREEAKIRLYEKLPADQKHASFLSAGLIIGTIANFYKTKGLDILIKAIKMLIPNSQFPIPNFSLIIIGDGPERKNLELLIANCQLQNRVILASRIPDAHKYLPAFDIFVLPSVKEGFPWALLEAMSAKLPVIATAVGAAPEIIEKSRTNSGATSELVRENGLPAAQRTAQAGLLVPPRDPQALANSIARLVQDESLRRELAIQAHQTVLHRFSLTKMISQIEAIL